jgi:hypothetical protein
MIDSRSTSLHESDVGDHPGEPYQESGVPKLSRLSTVLCRPGLALVLAIGSAACRDDRVLGELVDLSLPGLCGGAPCDGWCERPQGACDAPTTQGICRPNLAPEERNMYLAMCARIVPMDRRDRLCGCDGRTFARDCERVVSQVSLFSAGSCSGLACTDTADCAVGEFCEFVEGSCRSEGTCQPGGPAASAVRCNPDPRASCGCDGKTYGSECDRHRAGVSKWLDGPCQAR